MIKTGVGLGRGCLPGAHRALKEYPVQGMSDALCELVKYLIVALTQEWIRRSVVYGPDHRGFLTELVGARRNPRS